MKTAIATMLVFFASFCIIADEVSIRDDDVTMLRTARWLDSGELASFWTDGVARIISFQSGQSTGRRDIEFDYGYTTWAVAIPGTHRIALGSNRTYGSGRAWSIKDLDTGKTLETWKITGFEDEYEPKENGVYLQASSTLAYTDGDGKVWVKAEGKEARAMDLALPADFYPVFLLETGDSLLVVKSDRRWLVNPETGAAKELPALAYRVLAMAPLGDTGKAVALHRPLVVSPSDRKWPLSLDIVNPLSGAIVNTLHTGKPYPSKYYHYSEPREMIDEGFEIHASKDGDTIVVYHLHSGNSLYVYQAPEWECVTLAATQDDIIFDLGLNPSGTLISINSGNGYNPGTPSKYDVFVSDLSGNRVWTIDIKGEMIAEAKDTSALLFWASLALLFVELLLAQYLTSRKAAGELALSLANVKWMNVLVMIELVAFTYYYVNMQMNIEWGIGSRGLPILVAILVLLFGSALNISSPWSLMAIGAAAIAASFGINWIYAVYPKGDNLFDTTTVVGAAWSTDTVIAEKTVYSEGSGVVIAPLQTLRMCVLVLGMDSLLSGLRLWLGARKR